MIDIIKSKMAFAKYAKNYDINNDKIRLKIAHMERVSKTSKELSIKKNEPASVTRRTFPLVSPKICFQASVSLPVRKQDVYPF